MWNIATSFSGVLHLGFENHNPFTSMWLRYRCSGEGAHELLSIQPNRLKYKNATHMYCCMWLHTVHIFTYIYTKLLRKKEQSR